MTMSDSHQNSSDHYMRQNQRTSYDSTLWSTNNIQNNEIQIGLSNDGHYSSNITMSNPSQPRDVPKTSNDSSCYENCPPPSYDELFPPTQTENSNSSTREILNISTRSWTPPNPQISTTYGFRVPNALSKSFGSISISTPTDHEYSIKTSLPSIDDLNQEFDRKNHADSLYEALSVSRVDENVIINLLATKNNWQRRIISREYEKKYGKDLIENLKTKLHGEFGDLIVFMMMPLAELYAQELSFTCSGITLVEVFCTLPFSEIENIREAYKLINGISLEQDLKNQSSGDFKNFMSSFCLIDRNENDIDEAAADIDAKKLLSSGVSDIESDNSAFRQILLQRNIPQLKMIFQKYENIGGCNIQLKIAEEFSGNSKNVLLAIVQCIENNAIFFAKQLHKCKRGLEIDYLRLTRIIVTRLEINIDEINQIFTERYGESLENFIAEIPGNYKTCLLALMSRN